MSFRTRLIGFFVVIVLLPMVAIGGLFYRVIADSEQGKTDAQATGLATAAGSVYEHALLVDRADAHRLAFDSGLLRARGARLRVLMAEAGLKRLVLSQSGRTLVDMGDRTALAPGVAQVELSRGVRSAAGDQRLLDQRPGLRGRARDSLGCRRSQPGCPAAGCQR